MSNDKNISKSKRNEDGTEAFVDRCYMNEEQMFSVIMPAYNMEKYIVRSVESVLAQTYGDFELLIIDDGSTDCTGKIVDELAEKDERIVVIHQSNSGSSATRNRALDAARGEFVAFLDADDLWDEFFLEKMYDKIVGCSGDFVYARTEERFMDGHSALIGSVQLSEGKFDKFLYKTGEWRAPFHISSIVIRRAVIEEYHIRFLVGLKLAEDVAFILQVLSVTKAVCVPEVLTVYCHRERSLTLELWSPKAWKDDVCIFEKIAEFVEKNYPEGMTAFRKMRNYRTYRFVLACAKRGFISEAREYADRWHLWLAEFVQSDGRIMDRLKCRGLMAADGAYIRLIGKL